MKASLADIVSEARKANSFLIATHAGPDGDAIGSMLALKHFLNALGKQQIICACADPVPQVYTWLPGAGEIVQKEGVKGPFDLVFVIDVAQLERIGAIAEVLEAGQKIAVIDHHLEENPCGAVNFVDSTYSSAAEIMVDIFEAAELELGLEAAQCAYVGLTTDTGSFRYSNTTAAGHRRAAKMLEAGVDPADISQRVFDVLSLAKLHLLRRVLDGLRLEENGRVAHTTLTQKDMDEASATHDDTDGLVNYGRNVEGVEVGILFRQVEPEMVKVSMRSKDGLNSAQILRPLGGGGHAAAAGATLKMGLDAARKAVLEAVSAALIARDTAK